MKKGKTKPADVELRKRRQQLKDSLKHSQAKKLSDRVNAKAKQKGKSAQSSVLFSCMMLTTIMMFVSLAGMAMVAYPIKPVLYRLLPPKEFKGAMSRNDVLKHSTQILKDEITGPESLAVDQKTGIIYTGTSDGNIVEIDRGRMKIVTKLGKGPCGKLSDEPRCGRPLGMRFDKDGQLIVADAYLGLFRVNPKTGEKTLLLSSSTEIEGVKPKFLNDIEITSEGKIYVSDSSTRWHRKDLHYLVMEAGPDGRVIWYDPAQNTTGVLVEGLHFPNGLQLSPKEDILYIAESNRARIMKYHLKGLLKGRLNAFTYNLPGSPDNIRASQNGGYWLGFANVRIPEFYSLQDMFSPYPWLRNIMSKLISHELFLKLALKNAYGLVIELDQNGNILRSLHDATGEVIPSVSEVLEWKGNLYLGSFYLPQISTVDLKEYENRRV